VHHTYPIDPSKVTEIFIDATYNTSKTNTHLYSIVGQELGYSTPLAFMLMEIHDKENTKSMAHAGEALQCNRNFYTAAKNLGLYPKFVHTDKDWSEISAAQVFPPQKNPFAPIVDIVEPEIAMFIVIFFLFVVSLCIRNYLSDGFLHEDMPHWHANSLLCVIFVSSFETPWYRNSYSRDLDESAHCHQNPYATAIFFFGFCGRR
jgi:hypothetical protein